MNYTRGWFFVCYLGFDSFRVLVLEQELDLAFAVVGRAFELGELVPPEHCLQVRQNQTHYEDCIYPNHLIILIHQRPLAN